MHAVPALEVPCKVPVWWCGVCVRFFKHICSAISVFVSYIDLWISDKTWIEVDLL